MDQNLHVTAIAHLIQLAIAPVFLLAGIAGILNVLAQRLARVVDRGRSLERDFESFDEATRERASEELLIIVRRMRLVNLAITACTASALFVCLVVAILFVADLAQIAFARPIAVLFIVAMTLLIVGLTLFLAEIRLAARSSASATICCRGRRGGARRANRSERPPCAKLKSGSTSLRGGMLWRLRPAVPTRSRAPSAAERLCAG